MLHLEQLQKIDLFFEDKGLEFYDLRMELVDHVSEAIENTMKAHPGMSFDQAFDEETGKFTRRDLVLQLSEAYEQDNPIKEWRYFNLKRIAALLLVFLLLISPVILLNSQLLIYIEMFYLLASTAWHFNYLLRFKRQCKNPRKKLSIYFSGSWYDYLFSILLFDCMYLNTRRLMILPGLEEKWIFVIFVFLELLTIASLLAKTNIKKQQYHTAKNTYPFLFEN